APPDEDPETREQRQTRNRSRNQRRITAALRRQHKAEFERDQAVAHAQQIQAQWAALQQRGPESQQPPAAPVPAAAPADASSVGGLQKPKEEDFERYADFVEATAKFQFEVQRAAEHVQRMAHEDRVRAQEAARVFETRQQAARDKYSDYDAVVSQPIPINQAIAHAVK